MIDLNGANEIATLGNNCTKLITYLPKSYKTISRNSIELIFNNIANDDKIPYADRIALINNASRIIKHYSNQQQILEKADKYLLTTNSSESTILNEDWFDLFLEECKTTSNEELQELWAKLLSEECKKSNSIRKDLLFTLKFLDLNVARNFQKISDLVFDIQLKTNDGIELLKDFVYIDELSFEKIELNMGDLLEIEKQGLISLSYGAHFFYQDSRTFR